MGFLLIRQRLPTQLAIQYLLDSVPAENCVTAIAPVHRVVLDMPMYIHDFLQSFYLPSVHCLSPKLSFAQFFLSDLVPVIPFMWHRFTSQF